MSNSRELQRTLKTGLILPLISDTRFRCALWDGEWLQSFFALSAVLASEVGYTVKTIDQIRLVPDSSMYPVPTTLPMVFRGRRSSVRMSRTTVRSREVLALLSVFAVTTPLHRCWTAYVARDRLVSA